MKAITCTQCGATIENVSETSLIINCDYCGARLILDPRRPAPVPPPVPAPSFEFANVERPNATSFAVGIAALFLIPIIIVFFVYLGQSQRKPERAEPSYVYTPPPSPYPAPAWSVSTEPAKPTPIVNYQPRVSWDGPNDMEHFADPEVDISSVAHLSSDEIKKTVFKDRTVKLRVVINTEGEIDDVTTVSGHPILVQAATQSARSSIFRSRSKPTTRILTYTFRLLKD